MYLVNIKKKLLNMAIEIVDLPSYKMVIFHSYVKVFPEGNVPGIPEGTYKICCVNSIFSIRNHGSFYIVAAIRNRGDLPKKITPYHTISLNTTTGSL